VDCSYCFPPALNHCKPGQDEGDETAITMEMCQGQKSSKTAQPKGPSFGGLFGVRNDGVHWGKVDGVEELEEDNKKTQTQAGQIHAAESFGIL